MTRSADPELDLAPEDEAFRDEVRAFLDAHLPEGWGTRDYKGPRDEAGRIRPILFPGTDFTLDADTVFAAIGQAPDLSLLPPGLRRDGASVAVGCNSR